MNRQIFIDITNLYTLDYSKNDDGEFTVVVREYADVYTSEEFDKRVSGDCEPTTEEMEQRILDSDVDGVVLFNGSVRTLGENVDDLPLDTATRDLIYYGLVTHEAHRDDAVDVYGNPNLKRYNEMLDTLGRMRYIIECMEDYMPHENEVHPNDWDGIREINRELAKLPGIETTSEQVDEIKSALEKTHA